MSLMCGKVPDLQAAIASARCGGQSREIPCLVWPQEGGRGVEGWNHTNLSARGYSQLHSQANYKLSNWATLSPLHPVMALLTDTCFFVLCAQPATVVHVAL
jgi:hypothetical protein